MRLFLAMLLACASYQDFSRIYYLRSTSAYNWQLWRCIKGQTGRALQDVV
jgi:hypothetical protein